MLNRKTPESNSELQVLGVKEFYEAFQLEKRRYHPSLFCVGTKTKKKRTEFVPLKLYKQIIKEYLKLYFYDLYMNSHAIYFPLGGFMKKVTYPKWVKVMTDSKNNKRIHSGQGSIGFFWYLRPSKKMFYMVTLKKLTGSTNQVPRIEKIYKDNFNKDLIPIFKPELKKAKRKEMLYLCTLT